MLLDSSMFPSPCTVIGENSDSPLLFIGEHASNKIPKELNRLSLSEEDLQKHIAYDIGTFSLVLKICRHLDICYIYQNYSRLLADCNRHPDSPSFIPESSENIQIPGNQNLSPEEKEQRKSLIRQPFYHQLEQLLDNRLHRNIPTIPISIHSFTPVYFGKKRKGHFGVLDNTDNRYSRFVFQELKKTSEYDIRMNEPYRPEVAGILPFLHTRNLETCLLEIRNDLIAEETGRQKIFDLLIPIFDSCLHL